MRAFTRPALALAAVAIALSGSATVTGACERRAGAAEGRGPRMAVVRVATKTSTALTESFKPFSIKFPDQFDPKSFTNRATVDIEILPDGTVGSVKLVKSTGISSVDEQVQHGVKEWRFGKRREKLFLYLTLVIEIR